jgi:hypothetical protein
MEKLLLIVCMLFASAFLNAATRQNVEIPISIPIADAVQHQQDLYFASHVGLLKLSDGNLFKLKDSGIDLGRLRQVEISQDQNHLYAGGFGLFQLNLTDYSVIKVFPGWVSRFAISDKYYYVDTGSDLWALPKDETGTKTKIFEFPIVAITQVDREVFALTQGGLYALMNTVSRLVKQGQFKSLLSNPLYMVMTDSEFMHVFSRTTNQWHKFTLPKNVSKIEMSSQEDAVWVRSNGIWKKFSLINFQLLDSIDKPAAFFYDSPSGPVLFDGTTLTLNKKISIFDIQSKSLVASAVIEPFIYQSSAGVFASGVGGIYSVTTGEIVLKTDEHITAFETRDGTNFTIGTNKGVILPDGQLINNGFVSDIERYQEDTMIAFEHSIYRLNQGALVQIPTDELKGQEILNLKSEQGKLFVLTDSHIFTYDNELKKIASLKQAVWEDVAIIKNKLYALSYNHGIFEVGSDGSLNKIDSLQSLPNRFFVHNQSVYVIGREGVCRLDVNIAYCKQISASVTGRSSAVTNNGIYYSNPHGVWLLDERALVSNPILQYVVLNQRAVIDKNIKLDSGQAIVLHFDRKDGTVFLDGKEYSIYNHQVVLTPEKSVQINGWYIDVRQRISWLWLLLVPVMGIAWWALWSLVKAKSVANAEFVRLSRYQLHADEIRKACDMSLDISHKLNMNNELALSDAIYKAQELQEILAPIAMNARLRDTDNLTFAINSHVASIFSIHPELDVSIGECDKINSKLNADAFHLLIHMLRYAIDQLGASKAVIHVLRESENDCLLCVEHDGKTETKLNRFISRSTDHMIMKAIAREYGQALKFFSNEINVMLSHNPQIKATPQQAYFLASASKFGLKIQK